MLLFISSREAIDWMKTKEWDSSFTFKAGVQNTNLQAISIIIRVSHTAPQQTFPLEYIHNVIKQTLELCGRYVGILALNHSVDDTNTLLEKKKKTCMLSLLIFLEHMTESPGISYYKAWENLDAVLQCYCLHVQGLVWNTGINHDDFFLLDVKPGAPTSGLLFTLYVNHLVKMLKQRCPDDVFLSHLTYTFRFSWMIIEFGLPQEKQVCINYKF